MTADGGYPIHKIKAFQIVTSVGLSRRGGGG